MTKRPAENAPAKAAARPRGRPSGTKKNRGRNLYVHSIVDWLMSLGLSREKAVAHARPLLACDGDGIAKLLGRKAPILCGKFIWTGDSMEVEVLTSPTGDETEVLTAKVSVLIAMGWMNRWPPHPAFGLGDKPICLSAKSIERIFDDIQGELSTTLDVECPACGHLNKSTPARGEHFRCGDPCRKCGAGTSPDLN